MQVCALRKSTPPQNDPVLELVCIFIPALNIMQMVRYKSTLLVLWKARFVLLLGHAFPVLKHI
ncbi:UNVERIFIED_CONTAM: hypothetical protein FKN15_034982 [Acipenser sinensis]